MMDGWIIASLILHIGNGVYNHSTIYRIYIDPILQKNLEVLAPGECPISICMCIWMGFGY